MNAGDAQSIASARRRAQGLIPRSPDTSFWLLSVLAFGVFIAADDLTVVSAMLPRMIVDFEIPSGLKDASWIVSAYLIAYVVAMPLFGRLSDRYGRLQVYTACMALFLIGSIG
ncbi:MFS transporter, partial [Thermoflexus sp.]|uniref:MFS transporter n=1 Tax=Thermoflexus sp. TaxID=1969742 RepID=UPI0035E440E2